MEGAKISFERQVKEAQSHSNIVSEISLERDRLLPDVTELEMQLQWLQDIREDTARLYV